jgi:hypothetical protein
VSRRGLIRGERRKLWRTARAKPIDFEGNHKADLWLGYLGPRQWDRDCGCWMRWPPPWRDA